MPTRVGLVPPEVAIEQAIDLLVAPTGVHVGPRIQSTLPVESLALPSRENTRGSRVATRDIGPNLGDRPREGAPSADRT